MEARWARRLVGGFVLVEQDEHARLHHRRQQRRARAGREPRRAVGQLPPRLSTSPLVHAGIEPDHAVELREPLRPPRRRLDIGRDHERAALRLLDPLEYLFLPTRSDQQRRTLVRRDARGAGGRLRASVVPSRGASPRPGRRGVEQRGGVEQRRRQQRGECRADGREALRGDPADEVELGRYQDRCGIGDAEQGLEARVHTLAQRHYHADARGPAQRGQDPLAWLELPAVRHTVGKRVREGGVEGDVRDHPTWFGGGRIPVWRA